MKSSVILLSLLSVTLATPPEIFNLAFFPLGSYHHKSYYLSQKLRTDWIGAFNFCRSQNMELLSLDDGDEADNFFLILNNNARQFDTETYVGGMTTLGGSKTLWYWVNNGDMVNFGLNWSKGEPNNGGNSIINLGKTEYCLGINLKKGVFGFNDLPCFTSTFYQFICQAETEIEEQIASEV